MAMHSSTFAWEIPWKEEQTTVYGVAKSQTQLSTHTHTHTELKHINGTLSQQSE